jgi:hypothetical protein
VTTRIRHEIWVKVLGNASFNPVSALTRATLAQIARDPGTASVIRSIMQEVEEVSTRLGMELPISIDQRIAGAEKVGEHKTSMLQDLEAGRPMELEALVGSVVELGERVGLPMTCTVSELLDFRKMLEPPLAARAATHASPDEISEMEEILQRQEGKLSRGETTIAEDAEFHYSVALASGNSVVLKVLDILMDLLRDTRERSLQVEGRPQEIVDRPPADSGCH